jgi:hypothetical protein
LTDALIASHIARFVSFFFAGILAPTHSFKFTMFAIPPRPLEHPISLPSFSGAHQHFLSHLDPHDSSSARATFETKSTRKSAPPAKATACISSSTSKWLRRALVVILLISGLAVIIALVAAGSHPLFQLGGMRDAPNGGGVEEGGDQQEGLRAVRRAIQSNASDGDAFVREKCEVALFSCLWIG